MFNLKYEHAMMQQSASSIWSNLLSNAMVNIIEIVHNCVYGGEANVYVIEILGLRPSNRLPVSYYNKYDFMVYLGIFISLFGCIIRVKSRTPVNCII